MQPNPQLDYTEQQIDQHIGFYTGRRNYNRRMASVSAGLSATLAAITTIAVGAAKMFGPGWIGATGLPLLALITSGMASVLAAWTALFANRKLWVINNTTLAALYELQSDIAFRKKDTKTDIAAQEVNDFYGRLKKIISEAESALKATHVG